MWPDGVLGASGVGVGVNRCVPAATAPAGVKVATVSVVAPPGARTDTVTCWVLAVPLAGFPITRPVPGASPPVGTALTLRLLYDVPALRAFVRVRSTY